MFSLRLAILTAMSKKGVRTARSVADASGINTQTIQLMISGKVTDCKFKTIRLIASSFDMAASEFIALGETK